MRIRRLSPPARMILVLRNAGRPLHVSEVRAHHNKLFGFDVEEHAASAVLQRLEEALIVERGVYALYEHLHLTEENVRLVRDASFARLKSVGHFLSAKILQRDLVDELAEEICTRLTPYKLLGICQDDPRFLTRRGLMIGLAVAGFESSFTSLTDMIHDVVREHGPVTLADIREHISHERDVLDTSITMILQSSPEIAMPEQGLYDVIERVIGDEHQIDRVTWALQIALVDGPASLPILTSRLAAIGLRYSSSTVLSLLRNIGSISQDGNIFRLISSEWMVAAYNEAFHKIYDPAAQGGANREALSDELNGQDAHELIDLDFRLAVDPATWKDMVEGRDGKSDLLGQLMAEFEF